ncbi:hypothetical protein PFICI_08169 [Pestalotiopsis fici W106-1]|uniref:Ig-like domain-containing protein n=1 Tax=Pestalotiopsis fici (strain W106-1 / CGMCC3.15140) TaxID=1229662 RepID=W3X3I8_PESFW|nr:uncharacterized protein PFICI_08169 [Pestalotiopsis fici W106-1]ETS80640.1 hypothetical protein PFICI_08169 [Pestalotiopsis fici W106-1]
MSQIGRLQAALASATNEVTVAAANINFDFCLVKYDAPKEYQPIGALLSTQRKQDAESGSSHVTARRLAALLNGICPDTPNLLKAYGQRVSEISKTASSQESTDFANSMFAPYSGIDATSIWAAATSSEPAHGSALHVHLLASMLAKIWDPPEAISIWDELVKERRRVIADQLERGDSLPFSLATAAAQQDIPRAQLAAWDASARAWLQTANSIMAKQQTQLRLIVQNIQLPISGGTNLYSSVNEAWIKALTVMERLVSGTPQEIHDGAALLGLAAWHIYPDMQIFGAQTLDIPMQDALVKPGGVLTLGCATSASTPTSGITWSLSLANLKFYGRPVESQGWVQSNPDHISFHELMLATLGRVMTLWNISWEEVPLLAKVLMAMAAKLRQNPSIPLLLQGIEHLAEAASAYLREPTINSPFVNLGINRPEFLSGRTESRGNQPIQPVFYLNEREFLAHLKNNEARILFLRRLAGRILNQSSDPPECIIRCNGFRGTEWASVFPENPAKRGASCQGLPHARWNPSDPRASPTEVHYNNSKQARIHYVDQAPFVQRRQGAQTTPMTEWFGDTNSTAIYVKYDPTQPAILRPQIDLGDLLWALEKDLLLFYLPEDEVTLVLENLAFAYERVFKYISSPTIRLQTFLRPLSRAGWISFRKRLDLASPTLLQKQFSILSYFVSDHNVEPLDIPENICGISIGDSFYCVTLSMRITIVALQGY